MNNRHKEYVIVATSWPSGPSRDELEKLVNKEMEEGAFLLGAPFQSQDGAWNQAIIRYK